MTIRTMSKLSYVRDRVAFLHRDRRHSELTDMEIALKRFSGSRI